MLNANIRARTEKKTGYKEHNTHWEHKTMCVLFVSSSSLAFLTVFSFAASFLLPQRTSLYSLLSVGVRRSVTM